VRRSDTSLYARLWEDFHRPGLRADVIWDRRDAERRHPARSVAVERRRWRRRQRDPDTWTTFGFVMATVQR